MKYGFYTGPKLKTDIISGLGSAHPVSRLFVFLEEQEKSRLCLNHVKPLKTQQPQTSAYSTKTLTSGRISSDVIVYIFPH